MKNEHDSPENVEQRLQQFFDKKADELKAPSNLWAKLEPRLDNPKKTAPSGHQTKILRHWLFGPRLIGVASSLAVVLLLLVTGLVWLTTDNGNDTSSTGTDQIALSPSSGAVGSNVTVSGGGYSSVDNQYYGYYSTSESTFPGGIAGTKGDTGDRGPTSGGGGSVVESTPTIIYDADGTVITTSIEGTNNALDNVHRQVISTAAISLEVQTVDTAISQIRGIAESLGGFLEQMSSSGGENTQQASVTIRVPQAQFFTALDRLQALGTVQNQNLGSEDVSERFIDLEARLKSAQQEEQSLLALLEKTQTITDIITLERQLSQVRSNIESIQGQLNYIERRVDLATINMSLYTPSKVVGQAPSGSMTIAVHNVGNTVDSIKGLVSSVNGDLGQVSVSVNEGKENAILSFQVYRDDFSQVVTSIERQGKTQQKYIQEGTTPQGEQVEPAEEPDAYMSVTLIETESHGFWTSGNIMIISITGSIVLIALLVFLFIASRKGLLQKNTV